MSRLSPLNRRGPRVRIKPGWTNEPVGFAICDGCGFAVMYTDLRPHMDYRGGINPVPDGLMVCGSCDDQPQPFFQLQVLPPDPVPLSNPRPDDRGDVTGNIALESAPAPLGQPQNDFIELESGNGVIELDEWPYPQYETGTLPNPANYEAGYQIDVLGLGAPIRAYADTINWKRVDTDAVIS
jgi:hypothetical protein